MIINDQSANKREISCASGPNPVRPVYIQPSQSRKQTKTNTQQRGRGAHWWRQWDCWMDEREPLGGAETKEGDDKMWHFGRDEGIFELCNEGSREWRIGGEDREGDRDMDGFCEVENLGWLILICLKGKSGEMWVREWWTLGCNWQKLTDNECQ